MGSCQKAGVQTVLAAQKAWKMPTQTRVGENILSTFLYAQIFHNFLKEKMKYVNSQTTKGMEKKSINKRRQPNSKRQKAKWLLKH